jgi:sporulation protein YlmC with PRC-barrel domain
MNRLAAKGRTEEEVAMADSTQFTIGVEATCADGLCGEVTQVVVDPIAGTVTDLIVEPKHRQGLGRLIPLDLVSGASAAGVQLTCTLAEFEELEHAEETQFLPGSGGHADYRAGEALSQPYYGLTGVVGDVPQAVTYDALPLDEVAVRRGEQVHARDGNIGTVEGLAIDPRNHHVTHVLLQEGHLWGRKQVAIPIGHVTSLQEGIRLDISKQQVQDLPPIGVEGPNLSS